MFAEHPNVASMAFVAGLDTGGLVREAKTAAVDVACESKEVLLLVSRKDAVSRDAPRECVGERWGGDEGDSKYSWRRGRSHLGGHGGLVVGEMEAVSSTEDRGAYLDGFSSFSWKAR